MGAVHAQIYTAYCRVPFCQIFFFKKGKSIIKSVIQNNVKLKRFHLNGCIHRVLFTNI